MDKDLAKDQKTEDLKDKKEEKEEKKEEKKEEVKQEKNEKSETSKLLGKRPSNPINENVIRKKHSFMVSGTTFTVDKKYELIKGMGHGAYGVVCAAYDKVEKERVAIKKVNRAFDDLIDAKRILREIKLLEFFDHENVISLIDVLKPESKTEFEDIYIVTDLMDTDLQKVIYSPQVLTDDHIQYFVYQILRGLYYMHSADVIHRDLKPSNLLVNKKCDLKICDLGLGRGYEQNSNTLTGYVVTRWYRAPEVILSESEYSKPIDIWAVGCILAEIMGKAVLFPGDDYLDQIKRIVAILGTPTEEDMNCIANDLAKKYVRGLPPTPKKPWESMFPKHNPVLIDLLSKMVVFNPAKRLTVKECLEHPYFNGIHDAAKEPVCEKKFDWSFDNFEPTKELMQEKIYAEALRFHKDDE